MMVAVNYVALVDSNLLSTFYTFYGFSYLVRGNDPFLAPMHVACLPGSLPDPSQSLLRNRDFYNLTLY